MRRQQGFSYGVAMFVVAMLTVFSLRGLENSLTKERRAKEAELLFAGQAYRDAIRKYYDNTPGFAKHYPPDVRALLQDVRATRMSRPLRKLYWDPITASQDWGVVPAPDGGVMGVYSLSSQQPLKIDGFPAGLTGFIGAKSYQDWKFVYQPS
jgi:type II secretory pathway pseudopilin PulG